MKLEAEGIIKLTGTVVKDEQCIQPIILIHAENENIGVIVIATGEQRKLDNIAGIKRRLVLSFCIYNILLRLNIKPAKDVKQLLSRVLRMSSYAARRNNEKLNKALLLF
jgi:hypothetical protein